jgi:glycogen(starch) synthase
VGGLTIAAARAGIVADVLLVRDPGQGGYGCIVPVDYPTIDQPGAQGPARLTLYQAGWADMEDAAVELARRLRPDLVHVHPVELWRAARRIREALGTPVVYTAHSLNVAEYEIGQDGGCASLWRDQQELIRGADRVIALTPSERDLLIESCPGAEAKVRVVGNGIDDCAAARSRAFQGRHGTPPLVLFAGRFVERKGIRDLLAAIPQVLAGSVDAHFTLVGGYGTGPDIEREWLPATLRPYRDRVHFTGWLSPAGVTLWYRAADVLVVPSWYEPFGLVVLEGMLHGLAMAAADTGGPAAILEDGKTGLLFSPKDVDALAATLLRLVRDGDLRRRLGTAAAREVRRNWLWTGIVGRVAAVYREAVEPGD